MDNAGNTKILYKCFRLVLIIAKMTYFYALRQKINKTTQILKIVLYLQNNLKSRNHGNKTKRKTN